MGLRGIIKDILITYLAIIIIIAGLKGGKVTTTMITISVILLLLVAWFMLERFGVVDQM